MVAIRRRIRKLLHFIHGQRLTLTARLECLNRWYSSRLGQTIFEEEQAVAADLFKEYQGTRILQLSTQDEFARAPSSPFRHFFQRVRTTQGKEGIAGFMARYDQLPFAESSLDIVLIHHVLEHVENPQQVLKEAARVVTESGFVVVFVFNPFSSLGCRRMFDAWLRPRRASARWNLSSYRLADWLKFVDFTPLQCRYLSHLAFLNRPATLNLRRRTKTLCSRLNLPSAPVYCMVARKDVLNMRMIEIDWKSNMFKRALAVAKPLPQALTPTQHTTGPSIEKGRNIHRWRVQG